MLRPPVVVIAVSLAILASLPLALGADQADLGGHTIRFLGVETTAEGYYKWTYEVYSDGPPALSFWIIGFCGGQNAIVAASGPYEYTTDPHTGIRGIKFEANMEEGETRTFYFVLRYDYPHDPSRPVAVGEKSAGDVFQGGLTGPLCETSSVPEFGESLSVVSLIGVVAAFTAVRLNRKR